MARAGVNFARCATVFAFAASTFASTAPASAAVRVVPHDQNSTVTWTLVNTPCTPGAALGSITLGSQAVPTGRGCYDPAGALFQSDWTVNEGSATWDVPGRWSAQYSYSVPDTVSSSASLPMSIDLQELAGSSSGFHEQFCVTGGSYVTVLQSDPCARAGTDVAFGTASGSATLTLDSTGDVPAGTTDIVTIGFGDGGHLYFDYHAGPTPLTTYHYSVEARTEADHLTDTYSGHGTFKVPTGSYESAQVFSPHGSMTAVVHGPHGTHTVLLTLTRATFSARAEKIVAFFRVTRSTLTCAPVRRPVEFDMYYQPGREAFVSELCHRSVDEHPKISLSP